MNTRTDDLVKTFVAQGGRVPSSWSPAYSFAPTQRAAIVRETSADADAADGSERLLEVARWDWPKPPSRPKGAPIINARIEKLPTGFWVGAFSNSRCIVPMVGYYEWTGEKGDKQPHFIHGDGVLAAAGLTWFAEVNGERQRVFVVVTREARDASGEVHDRMPAFLGEDLWANWLDPASLTVEGDTAASRMNRQQLLDAVDASSTSIARTMRTYEVGRKVNNSRAMDPTDPTLIEPVS